MNPYQSVTVEIARQISKDFNKDIVIINAWNHEHALLHTVTYGVSPSDKLSACNAGEICAAALGMDLAKKVATEDFRTVDATRNAQLRDLADRAIHVLRSYQFGNSAPDLAKELADQIESILKSKAL